MRSVLAIPVLLLLALGVQGQSADEDSSLEYDLRTVATLAAIGEHADALSLIEGLKADHPDSLEVHIAYQDLKLATGATKELVKEYAARVSSSGGTPDALYLHARLLEGSKALSLYKKALRLDPQHFHTLCGIGNNYLAAGKFKDAEKHLTLARSVRRSSAVPWNSLGCLAERRGDFDLAEEHYRSAINVDVGHAVSQLNLGTLLIMNGDLDEAEEVLLEAARLAPGSPMPILARGILLLAREKLLKEEELDVAEGEEGVEGEEEGDGEGPPEPPPGLGLPGLGGDEAAPDDPSDPAGEGEDEEPEGDEQEEEEETARSLFEDAVELETNTFTSLNMLGLAYTEIREFGLAKAAFTRAIAKNKKNPLSHLNLCHMALQMGQTEVAQGWVRQAIRLDSKSAQAYYFTGLCESALGKSRNAETAFLRAMKLDDENVLYWRTLGAHYAILGKWKEAVRTLTGAVDLAGEVIELQLDLAFALTGAGSYARAVTVFESVVEEDPERLSAWLNLGLLYKEKLRSAQKAIWAFEEYQANGGDDERVDTWLGELTR